MQAAHKVVAVLWRQAHERAAHQDELDLVDDVAEAPQLLDAAARLRVGVVARADGAHAGRLVAGVRLRAVLKVAVGAPGAVDANVAFVFFAACGLCCWFVVRVRVCVV